MAIHQAILPSVRLETLPKATIDIFITIIEADGIEGCIAAGAIAASAALVDAGIEVFGLVVSTSAVSLYNASNYNFLPAMKGVVGNEIWLDPTHDEASKAKGNFVLAYMPALETITSVYENGAITPAELLSVSNPCSSWRSSCSDLQSSAWTSARSNVQICMLQLYRHYEKVPSHKLTIYIFTRLIERSFPCI